MAVVGTFEALGYLAKGYFHQDYDDVHGDEMDVLDDFRAAETPVRVRQVIAKINELIHNDPTENQLRELWLERLDSSYDPAGNQTTYRQWFEQMRQYLGAAAGDGCDGVR